MLKPKISFKRKNLTCTHCGLLKTISKWRIKIGDEVFFNVNHFNKNFEYISQTVNGVVFDRQNKFLIVLDKNSVKRYFIDQNQVHSIESPALFLYNMYGKCLCNENNK